MEPSPPPSDLPPQRDSEPQGTLLPIPDPEESRRLLGGARGHATGTSAPRPSTSLPVREERDGTLEGATDEPGPFRSGFVALIGRPNVGKSTLLNQLVGQKVAITSPVAQTTRNRLRAILTTAAAQLVLVDTPGIHKPHHLLGQRLVQSARAAIGEVDVVLFLVDGSQPAGRGDAFIAELLRRSGMPVYVALNKCDQRDPSQAEALESSYRALFAPPASVDAGARAEGPPAEPEPDGAADGTKPTTTRSGPSDRSSRGAATPVSGDTPASADMPASAGAPASPDPEDVSPWDAAALRPAPLDWPLFQVSALTGEGCEDLVEALSAALPPGPHLYPPEAVSDQPEILLLAELIREQVLQHTREEVPHSVAVRVERVVEDGPRTAVLATVLVERDSQKGILIGRGGRMLRTIGQGARLQMQKLIAGPVYLELFVKVVPGWRSHPGRLAELGYRGD